MSYPLHLALLVNVCLFRMLKTVHGRTRFERLGNARLGSRDKPSRNDVCLSSGRWTTSRQPTTCIEAQPGTMCYPCLRPLIGGSALKQCGPTCHISTASPCYSSPYHQKKEEGPSLGRGSALKQCNPVECISTISTYHRHEIGQATANRSRLAGCLRITQVRITGRKCSGDLERPL